MESLCCRGVNDISFAPFCQKPTKYKAPYSRDSKLHFKLRGRVVQGLGPIEALTQQQGE